MVQVWEAPVKRRYVAPVLSGAYFFKVISYLAWYIAPFFIAYASYSFWKKYESYREQPTVIPTHDFLLLVQGMSSGMPFTAFWSTVPEMNLLVANSQLRAPTLSKITDTDYNLDAKPELINFRVTIPVAATESVTSVRFMPFFAVNLTGYVKTDFASLVFLQHDSPVPGAEYRAYAHLQMRQVNPLQMRGKRTLYNNPYISRPDILTETDFAFESFLKTSLLQNETLFLDAKQDFWKTTTAGIAQDFSVDLTLRVSEQEITYIPLPSEVIKFALVQYFPIWYMLGWLIKKVMKFVYTQQILQSAVRQETTKAHQL
jgi:hypothetical protein